MNKLRSTLLALTAVAALLVAYPAKANLITNPGFETGDFTGWTQSGAPDNTAVLGPLDFSPHSGNFQAVAGPELGHGFLTQNLSTTPGASYVLDFWLAHTNRDRPAANFFAASWDGGPNLTSLTNASDFGYTEYMFNVTASTTNTVLQFEFFDIPGLFYLDDVSVEPTGVGVPDAGSTLSLLGLASLGLVALRRKLRC